MKLVSVHYFLEHVADCELISHNILFSEFKNFHKLRQPSLMVLDTNSRTCLFFDTKILRILSQAVFVIKVAVTLVVVVFVVVAAVLCSVLACCV